MMVTDGCELLDELRRLSQGLDSFAAGIFSDSLSAAEQLDFGYQLITVAARIRERVEQKLFDSSRVAGDTP